MKRPGQLRRSTPMPRGTAPLERAPRTPLKARGATKAKKEARYKAFLSSAAWKRLRKAALERAGHRCEVVHEEWMYNRCPETTDLTVHHKTYARFGGDELPEDLEVQCRRHHNRLHGLTPIGQVVQSVMRSLTDQTRESA